MSRTRLAYAVSRSATLNIQEVVKITAHVEVAGARDSSQTKAEPEPPLRLLKKHNAEPD